KENADDDPKCAHSSSSSSRSALNGCSASANSKHGKNARQEIVGEKNGLHQGAGKKVGVSSNRLNRLGGWSSTPPKQREAGRAPRPLVPLLPALPSCSSFRLRLLRDQKSQRTPNLMMRPCNTVVGSSHAPALVVLEYAAVSVSTASELNALYMSKFASSVVLPNLKILLNRRSVWFRRSPKSVPSRNGVA